MINILGKFEISQSGLIMNPFSIFIRGLQFVEQQPRKGGACARIEWK
jgi:hypothetical protein